jgi:hypothetical protein
LLLEDPNNEKTNDDNIDNNDHDEKDKTIWHGRAREKSIDIPLSVMTNCEWMTSWLLLHALRHGGKTDDINTCATTIPTNAHNHKHSTSSSSSSVVATSIGTEVDRKSADMASAAPATITTPLNSSLVATSSGSGSSGVGKEKKVKKVDAGHGEDNLAQRIISFIGIHIIP